MKGKPQSTETKRKLVIYSLFLTLVYFSNISIAAPPTIENVTHSPSLATPPNYPTNITADVIDVDGDLDHVYVNITTPIGSTNTYEMAFTNGSTYMYGYSTPVSGVFYYRIWAIDTANETTNTSLYYFLVANYNWRMENISINVYILSTCCGAIADMYAPEFVFINQSVVFLLFFENCGNVALNASMTLSVVNYLGDTVFTSTGEGWPRGTIAPLGEAFYWTIWIAAVPVGNYTLLGIVEYYALRFSEEYVVDDWAAFNATANCSARDSENVSTCTMLTEEECFDVSQSNVTTVYTSPPTNITQFPNLSVVGMNPGTTVYYGTDTFGIYDYNIFLFNMTSCGYYCYACMSGDGSINQEGECAYVEESISTSNYEVTSIRRDGQAANFTKMADNCVYDLNETICTVDIDANTAVCVESIYCFGITRDERYFEVVTQMGNFSGMQNRTSNVTEYLYLENLTNITEYVDVFINVTVPEYIPGSGFPPGQTQIAVEIEPLERHMDGYRGYWIPAVFNVTNIGGVPVDNITLIPIVPDRWDYQTAIVSYLNVSQTVNRTIFVRPPFDAELETYVIPVRAIRANQTLDIDYYWLTLKESYNRTLIELIEVLRTITMDANSNITVPILIENIGEVPLTEIFARLENTELCLDFFGFSSIDIMQPNETQTMLLFLRSKGSPQECKATLIVGSEEGAYAFTDVTIIVKPPPPLLPAPPDLILLLIILMILDGILMAIKKARERNGRDVATITRLIYILSFAIILLLIYVFWVAGYITLPELPSIF